MMEGFKKLSDSIQFGQDKLKKSSLFETDRIFCDLYCFEAGQTQPVHSHEGSDKVYFVVHGKGLFQIGEEERELGKDEIALASSGQKHGVRNPGPERLVLLVFMAPKPLH
ncbi:MAG: cupin domain-containing protein [Candidatus Binatia bacterium]